MSDNKSKDSDKQPLFEQLDLVDRVCLNVKQSVIVTTEDKIRLSLGNYLQNEKRRAEWITPFSLLVAIITTLVTSTFNKFILSGATWQAVFIITGVLAVIWLARALLFLRNNSSIECLIEEIKTGHRPSDAGGVL
uniref:hypothetical protein n=1 Tax=Candidatus Electronema sp. TaxID=2698783 RepID=UPI0040570D3C